VALELPIELELERFIFEEGGKPENLEENPRSKDKNQQLTCDAGSENQTRDTFVGGELSHYCATPAPQNKAHLEKCGKDYIWEMGQTRENRSNWKTLVRLAIMRVTPEQIQSHF